ncbi:MAG: hypothetical protein JWP89_908 [Schlesneria sp.]|nr:hypothetical protein [Schlesneria sp.]
MKAGSQGPTDWNSSFSILIVEDPACAWTKRCDCSATKSLEQETPHHSACGVSNEKELVIQQFAQSRRELGPHAGASKIAPVRRS